MFKVLTREEQAEFQLLCVKASNEELEEALDGLAVFKRLIMKEIKQRSKVEL